MEKIKYKISNMKLSEKIILINLLVLALPIIVVAILYFRDIQEKTINEAILNARHDLRSISSEITYEVERMIHIDELIISDYELKEFLSDDEKIEVEDFINFNKEELDNLSKIQITNPQINDLRVFFANKNLYEVWPNLYRMDRLNLSQYQMTMTFVSSRVWDLNKTSSIFSWKKIEDVESVVSVYQSIFYPVNHFIGILEVNMRIEDFYESLYKKSSKYSDFYFVKEDSVVQQKINVAQKDALPIQDLLLSLKDETEKRIQTEYGDFVLIREHLNLLDADVYAVVNLRAIDSEIKAQRNQIIWFAIGMIMILTLVLNRIINIILKKLKIVIDTMRDVQKGNLNAQIPFEGSDEIGELAYHFMKMLRRINELIDNILKKQAAVKDAEIRALQTQINSHFIYNVLENIKMRAEINQEYEISDSITHLGSLMRYSMQWNNHMVLLEDEMDYIKRYVELFNMRSDFYVNLKIDVDPDVMKMRILKMTIQPLIENAIEHGIVPKVDESSISVKSFKEEGKIYLEVEDNGIGISAQKLKQIQKYLIEQEYDEEDSGTSIGLLNVKNRLELFYDYSEGDFRIESEEGHFTKVIIRLKNIE